MESRRRLDVPPVYSKSLVHVLFCIAHSERSRIYLWKNFGSTDEREGRLQSTGSHVLHSSYCLFTRLVYILLLHLQTYFRYNYKMYMRYDQDVFPPSFTTNPGSSTSARAYSPGWSWSPSALTQFSWWWTRSPYYRSPVWEVSSKTVSTTS